MAERGRGCFKYSCLGCLAVAGIGILVFVVMAGLTALSMTREKKMEPLARVHALPAASPELGEARIDLGDPPPEPDTPRAAGRVVLDVGLIEFSIEPGPPGDPIRVEGRYDTNAFRLKESWEPGDDGEWVYRLKLAKRGMGFVVQVDDGGSNPNRLRLILPRDAPMTLEGRIGVGQSDLELGGLSLVAVDLELGTGEHGIYFGEPTPRPMERLLLDASIGELRVESVGNASPREVAIYHNLGEVRVDLDGEWRTDSRVELRCGIGECNVDVPRDVRVIADASVWLGESYDEVGRSSNAATPSTDEEGIVPTLHVSVSGKIGEVRVDN